MEANQGWGTTGKCPWPPSVSPGHSGRSKSSQHHNCHICRRWYCDCLKPSEFVWPSGCTYSNSHRCRKININETKSIRVDYALRKLYSNDNWWRNRPTCQGFQVSGSNAHPEKEKSCKNCIQITIRGIGSSAHKTSSPFGTKQLYTTQYWNQYDLTLQKFGEGPRNPALKFYSHYRTPSSVRWLEFRGIFATISSIRKSTLNQSLCNQKINKKLQR